MKFKVSYTFGATIIVEADSEEDAEEKVEQMPTDQLFDSNCRKGFEIQDVEEDDED